MNHQEMMEFFKKSGVEGPMELDVESVVSIIQDARLTERERCAQTVELYFSSVGKECAQAIREMEL